MDSPDLKSGITITSTQELGKLPATASAIMCPRAITITSTQELGKLLRQVRKSSGIKQATISGLANWGGRFIGDVENGKPTVQAQMLFDLIGWLGLEIVIRKKGSP